MNSDMCSVTAIEEFWRNCLTIVLFHSIRTSHVPRHPNLYEMSHVSRVPPFVFETIPQVVFSCSKCHFLEHLLHQHFWHGFLPISFSIWRRDTNVINSSLYCNKSWEGSESGIYILKTHKILPWCGFQIIKNKCDIPLIHTQYTMSFQIQVWLVVIYSVTKLAVRISMACPMSH